MPDLAEFIAALPKAELHLHLEGAVSAATAARLARRHGLAGPDEGDESSFAFADLAEFLRAYDLVCRSMRTAADFSETTQEALARCAASGARYVEMFFSPHAHKESGVGYDTMLSGILSGFEAARRAHGLEARLIPAHSRELGPEAAERFLDEVLANRTREVIGIGLDYQERPFPPAPFARTWERARKAGLEVTAHAGEDGPAAYVRDSMERLGCRRIDHGYHVVDDPDLVALCRARGLAFTVCPTTTLHTTIWRRLDDPDHAIRRMIEAGLEVMINTDDPGLFGTDLNREYRLVAEAFGLSRRALADLALAGLRASWLPDAEKRARLELWSADIAPLLAETA